MEMVEKSGESPWHLLLWPLPQRYTREEIYSYYRHASDITKFQVLETPDGKRMGALQMKTGLDLMVSSCRFLAEGDTKMPHFIVQQPLQSLHEWMKTPFHIRVSFERTSDESLPDKLLNLFKKCGNVALLSQHSEHDRQMLLLQVDSSFTMGQICTGTSFMFGATKIELEEIMPKIDQQQVEEFLANAEEVVNRLEHYYQGLGLYTKNAVKEYRDNGVLQNYADSSTSEDREDLLDPLYPDDDFGDAVFDQAKVVMPQLPSLVKVCFPQMYSRSYLASLKGTPERQPEIEMRVVDSIDKLRENSIVIDESFFTNVESRICSTTTPKDRLKIVLKILRTKMRKLKRKEKQKPPGRRKRADSDACSEDDELEGDGDDRFEGAKKYRNCTAEDVDAILASRPELWTLFIQRNLIRPSLEMFLPPDENPTYYDLPLVTTDGLNRVNGEAYFLACTTWKTYLKQVPALCELPPDGWPEVLPGNIRLNIPKSGILENVQN